MIPSAAGSVTPESYHDFISERQKAVECADPLSNAISQLAVTPWEELKKASSIEILTKLLQNLKNEPNNAKFQKLNPNNAKINAAIMQIPGARGIMEVVGFQPKGDSFELASCDDLESRLTKALDELQNYFGSYHLYREGWAHNGGVRCVHWNTAQDMGGQFVSGGMDNQVKRWDPSGEALIYQGHQKAKGVDGVLTCTNTSEGHLVSGGRDGKIFLWDDATLSPKCVLEGHGVGIEGSNMQTVASIKCATSTELVSVGWDKTVRFWNLEDATCTATLDGGAMAVNGVCVLVSGQIVTASGDGSIKVWTDKKCTATVNAGTAPIRGLAAVEGQGVAWASVSNDGMLRLWGGREKWQVIAQTQASDTYLFAVCASPEEVITGGDDRVVKVWSVPSLILKQSIAHPSEVMALTMSTLGLLVGCGDGYIRQWSRRVDFKASSADEQDYMSKVDAIQAATADASATSATPTANSTNASRWDYQYPVELEHGKKMEIAWNRGEKPEDVAARFLAENGLGTHHLGDVVAFIHQASAMGGGSAQGSASRTTSSTPAAAGQFDFSYPVQVADGRNLTISWNRGDSPQVVAMQFAMQNSIPANEIQTIIEFVTSASGPGSAAPATATSAQAAAEDPAMLSAIVAMGFDEAQARVALTQVRWASVEAALNLLI